MGHPIHEKSHPDLQKWHTKYAIFHQAGTCMMPKEGVFALVIRFGIISEGDTIRVRNVG